MSDYISREAAIAYAVSGRIRTLPTTEDGENWIRVNEVRESLKSVPAADVVEVIRCKDCLYYDDTDEKGCWCDYNGDWVEASDYCYAAERREP